MSEFSSLLDVRLRRPDCTALRTLKNGNGTCEVAAASCVMLSSPPINVHGYRPLVEASSLESVHPPTHVPLAIEDASFMDATCSYGKHHQHGAADGVALDRSFWCKICLQAGVTLSSRHGDSRQCVEMHLKARWVGVHSLFHRLEYTLTMMTLDMVYPILRNDIYVWSDINIVLLFLLFDILIV